MLLRLVCFSVLSLLPALAFAEDSPAIAQPPAGSIRVVAKPAPPFVIANPGGEPTGLVIDLWRRVADELHYTSKITVTDTVPQVIDALKAKQADVGLGALTINSERLAAIDFSHPFYQSGFQILVPKQGRPSIFSALRSVAGELGAVILLLLVALLANTHLLWWLERRKNPESFPAAYWPGIFEAGWWSVSMLITSGCENLAPKAVGGRFIAIIWMLTGFALVSFVTARMASIMTVNTLNSEVRSLDDLRGAAVGTLAGTAAEDFLKPQPMSLHSYASLDEAARALEQGEVKGVVYDAPLLRYYLTQHRDANLQLVGALFEKHNYGIGLQDRSALRKDISRVVLRLEEDGFLDQLDRKWFGERGKEEGKAEK